jgi:hypothetical protein
MPLVPPGAVEEDEPGPRGEARKIRSPYARGELVRVAVGRNLAEAELIKGMLLEQGIPSILRRTIGFDVPDFLAAGPRDVLVPEGGAEAARELLGESEGPVGDEQDRAGGDVTSGSTRGIGLRLAALLLVGLLLFAALTGSLLLIAR